MLQKRLAWALFCCINRCVLSANRVYLIFCFINFFNFTPSPPEPVAAEEAKRSPAAGGGAVEVVEVEPTAPNLRRKRGFVSVYKRNTRLVVDIFIKDFSRFQFVFWSSSYLPRRCIIICIDMHISHIFFLSPKPIPYQALFQNGVSGLLSQQSRFRADSAVFCFTSFPIYYLPLPQSKVPLMEEAPKAEPSKPQQKVGQYPDG